MKYLLLIIGVFCCSTSIIFIKIGATDPVALSAYRLILGGLFISPMAFHAWKRHRNIDPGKLLRQSFAPAIFLGIHFISWIFGGRMTSSANASLVVNMVPVVMPFLLLIIVKERITMIEGAGTLIAMSGIIVLGSGDFKLDPQYAAGDLVCFLSMLLYAAYLIFARKYRDIPSIYLYVFPVYLIAGIFCLGIAILLQASGRQLIWIGPDLKMEMISILGLALIPTLLGHSLINWALTRIRGQVVAILNLSQFIFAGLMGYFLLGERPTPAFFFASILVVLGAFVIIRKPSQQA